MGYRSLTRVTALAGLAISVTACGGVPDPPATLDAVEIRKVRALIALTRWAKPQRARQA